MLGALALLLASTCPSVSAAGSLPTAVPPLRGDVDGDGRPDRVLITHAPRAPTTCGFFVVARTSRGDRAARLKLYEGKVTRAGDYARWYREPSVVSLAAVDRGPGLEILVRLWHGASRVGGALLTVRGTRLVPMRIAGSRDVQWVWGGGVIGHSHIDCVYGRASGFVAISGEWAERDGTVGRSRVLFRAEGTTFWIVRSRVRRHLRPGQTWRTDVPEVRGIDAFESCTVVAA